MGTYKLFNSPLPELKPTLGKFLIFIGILFCIAWMTVMGCTGHRALDHKVFRIGRDASWYPLQLSGKEKNLVAFTNELLLAIAKDQEFHFEIQDVRSHTLFEELERGDYDAVFSSLMPNALNRERYEFSDPFFLVGPVLVVLANSPITSLADMDGKIIGVGRGTSLVFNINQYQNLLVTPFNPNLLITPYNKTTTALDDLLNDKIDGVIMGLVTAYTQSHSYRAGQIKVIYPPLTDEGLRLVAKHSIASTYLLSKFNDGLKKMKEDGTYQNLLDKWGLAHPE